MSQLVRNQSGFSFIKTCIALFVIVIIAAAILIVETLIEASKVRSQILQLQEYKTAISSFSFKYESLPGDSSKARRYNLGDNGNGNQIIADSVKEGDLFWVHLGASNIIDYDPLFKRPPRAKIGQGMIEIYYNEKDNKTYFHIGNSHHIDANALTPLQAYRIDLKIDDGASEKGYVLAAAAGPPGEYGLLATKGLTGSDQNVCLSKEITAEYNTSNRAVLCSLDVYIDY